MTSSSHTTPQRTRTGIELLVTGGTVLLLVWLVHAFPAQVKARAQRFQGVNRISEVSFTITNPALTNAESPFAR